MTNTRILIIQDDHFAGTHLTERLIALGYTVCAAVSSGQEAIEKAAETHPDLALIDLGLEGDADGVDVAEQLSADIPVIFLTDGSEGDLLQRAEATQPYGYVLKPVDERQLHLNIKTALSLHNRDKHRETERESEHRAQLLENIFDSIEDGIVAIDEKGKYLIFNQSAKNMFGAPDPDLSLDQRSEYYGFFLERSRHVVSRCRTSALACRSERRIFGQRDICPQFRSGRQYHRRCQSHPHTLR